MSSIAFHSRDHAIAYLRGSERANISVTVSDMFVKALGSLREAKEWLLPLFPKDHYLHTYATQYPTMFERALETVLHNPSSDTLSLPEGPVSLWDIQLNTILALKGYGNDVIRLATRLHAQCEIHCWVEGVEDKLFLASLIESGLSHGIMRDNQGWDSVLSLLKLDGDFPIVCSYSVCESFPSFHMLPKEHPLRLLDEESDEYCEIDSYDLWDPCMQGLRERAGGLQLTKANWDTFYFGQGIDAYSLKEHAKKA